MFSEDKWSHSHLHGTLGHVVTPTRTDGYMVTCDDYRDVSTPNGHTRTPNQQERTDGYVVTLPKTDGHIITRKEESDTWLSSKGQISFTRRGQRRKVLAKS